MELGSFTGIPRRFPRRDCRGFGGRGLKRSSIRAATRCRHWIRTGRMGAERGAIDFRFIPSEVNPAAKAPAGEEGGRFGAACAENGFAARRGFPESGVEILPPRGRGGSAGYGPNRCSWVCTVGGSESASLRA